MLNIKKYVVDTQKILIKKLKHTATKSHQITKRTIQEIKSRASTKEQTINGETKQINTGERKKFKKKGRGRQTIIHFTISNKLIVSGGEMGRGMG